ncbi:MAG: MOSC domain-containing protein [Burkholderiales bacterium]
MAEDMLSLYDWVADVPHAGRLEWIGLRPAYRAPVRSVESAQLLSEQGLMGDHGRGRRALTLIQLEHLAVIAALCRVQRVEPASLRRNLVVSGINLAALKRCEFYLGGALLKGTGDCHPCTRMEQTLGPGGFQAMRGHGGITACVLEPGEIRLGDRVRIAKPHCTSGR